MGVPEFVKADMVKPGAVVIDVGVSIPIPRPKTTAAWWASRLAAVTLPAVPPIRRRRPYDHCHAAPYRPRRRPRQ